MSSEHVLEITDGNFEEEILGSDVPAMLDFGAEWCMPCKMIEPVVDELAGEYAGRFKVGKVDTEVCPGISAKFQITAIPTLIFFKNGQAVKMLRGLQQKTDLKSAIDEVLG